jgi:hypothetical protein
MKANEVIRIGRKRNLEACAAPSIRPFPDSICGLANSTINPAGPFLDRASIAKNALAA